MDSKSKIIADLRLVCNDLMTMYNACYVQDDTLPWDVNDTDNWESMSAAVDKAIKYLEDK